MKYIAAIVMFCCFWLLACNNKNEQPQKGIDQLKWLSGNWQTKGEEVTTTEEWSEVHDGHMHGRSDIIKGDSVIPFETVEIFKRDSSFFYEVKAAGQNNEQPVAFRMTSFSDSGFVAENPQHDFPKRITYRLVNKDSIHASIDGGLQMPDKKADFFYSRVKK